jgi:hypothetical protein
LNVQLLIDAIVRQTTVLVAQLATAGGSRAPLASAVSRTDMLRRFHRDDAEIVGGILHDLCESGFVFRVGAGPSTAYRAATKEDLDALASTRDGDGSDELIWAIIYREGPISLGDIEKRVRRGDLATSLLRLVGDGRVHEATTEGEKVYSSSRFEHHTVGCWQASGAGAPRSCAGLTTATFDDWIPQFSAGSATFAAKRLVSPPTSLTDPQACTPARQAYSTVFPP